MTYSDETEKGETHSRRRGRSLTLASRNHRAERLQVATARAGVRSVGEVFRGGGSGVGRARGAVGGRRAGGSCSRRDATYLLVAAAGLGDVALRALGLEDLRACESRHSRWERRVSWRTTGGDARVGRAGESMRRAFARVSTYPWRRHRREPQRRKPCFSACVRRAMPRQP